MTPYDLKRIGIKGYLSLADFIFLIDGRGKAAFYRRMEIIINLNYASSIANQRRYLPLGLL